MTVGTYRRPGRILVLLLVSALALTSCEGNSLSDFFSSLVGGDQADEAPAAEPPAPAAEPVEEPPPAAEPVEEPPPAAEPAPESPAAPTGGVTLPPTDAEWDYQIGGDYPLPAGVGIVSRDWYDGDPAPGAYSICYVNAFQTQPGSGRPDVTSAWPGEVVLRSLEDPNWPGEYLIDLSAGKREVAAAHVASMVDHCADEGFDAVEFDNLDSWTRFRASPFDRSDTVTYAALITAHAHDRGLAVAQKNSLEIGADNARDVIGFDFVIAEECGQWNECDGYATVYGDLVLAVEYNAAGFTRACADLPSSPVVRRDVNVTRPGSSSYRYEAC